MANFFYHSVIERSDISQATRTTYNRVTEPGERAGDIVIMGVIGYKLNYPTCLTDPIRYNA